VSYLSELMYTSGKSTFAEGFPH